MSSGDKLFEENELCWGRKCAYVDTFLRTDKI